MSTLNEAKLLNNGLWLTPRARLSWPKLAKPEPKFGGDPNKLFYSATLLFDTTKTNINPLLDAMRALAVEKFGTNKAKNTPNCYVDPAFQWCLQDGAEKTSNKTGEILQGYGPGIWYLTASTTRAPAFFDNQSNPVTDPQSVGMLFYAGAHVRAQLRFYDYQRDPKIPQKKPGIGAQLVGIQFVANDTPFGGTAVDADAFGAIDE